ncbi:MAG: hypothetical protein ACUVXA_17520 [Candidatus Jordarchaeum sp.]
MSEVVFEAFKFNEQLEIPTTPLEADYRLRGKIEPVVIQQSIYLLIC